MSLLMDALKRAEENKQDAARAITRGDRPANTGSGLALEPLAGEAPAAPPPVSLPDLADHIDALDADLAATPTTPPPALTRPAPLPPPPSAADPTREAVRNAFAAKASVEAEPSRRNLWLILAGGLVAGGTIAGYFWYQLSSLNGGSLARAPTGAPPPAAAPRPAPLAATPAPLPYAPPPAIAPASRMEAAADSQPSAFILPPRRPEPPAAATTESAPAPAAPIRLKRTPPQVDPNVARGYANLQGNTLEAARRDYEQALRHDPRNVDALLALAAIAQRQGHAAEAERYQQRAYEADPKDAAAQAAVMGNASGDPLAAESRLKTLLAAQPESGPLNFALGNLYSRQNRWPEAQQVYFNAVAAEGDNPDYLFNLAVSLDHLRQPKLAAQHYRLALEAAEKRPGAFDRERVQRRLRDLQP